MAMVLFGQDLTAIALSAMVGGIVTSLLVWLLAWRNGIDTFRLIIIGIGVRAMLVAFNTWLLLKASLETALTAGLWNAGSLNGLTWAKTPPYWYAGCACWKWAMIPRVRWASASNVRVC